ncbi:uncharacterized protein LY89DRAFT_756226 [Mollisia scopiformis]|uniref:Uncharacterized protein n=1 Tax=Mollisia scopiformis TaxID=149040 RepID=A0A194WYF4_MOLSC|nr:uncharacterized protein LY89DRAFT_756226 [Mollisia scopiformis]KUJ12970.1 hypothetical protein LY89DRAFT_756226 [Mollisia scopiformis]
MKHSNLSRHEILALVLQHNRSQGVGPKDRILVDQVSREEMAIVESICVRNNQRKEKYGLIQKAAVALMRDLEQIEKINCQADGEAVDWKAAMKRCREMQVLMDDGRKYVERVRSDELRRAAKGKGLEGKVRKQPEQLQKYEEKTKEKHGKDPQHVVQPHRPGPAKLKTVEGKRVMYADSMSPPGPLKKKPQGDQQQHTSSEHERRMLTKITMSEKGRRADDAYLEGLRLASEVRKFDLEDI